MTFLDTAKDLDVRSAILDARLTNPELPRELARLRRRRANWAQDKLVILAMDHPARRVTSASGDAWAMADRVDVLRRIANILMQPGIDGLLASPDIMEEIFLVNHWVTQQGGPDFLDGRVLIGSINRGGLAGTVFELDDFVTAYTAEAIADMNLDGGKMLFRLNPDSVDSGRTMAYCVDALRQLAAYKLPAFLEPLANPHSTDDLVKLVGVATAMGHTSSRLWLKLPMTEAFERVAAATTCPIVLLGGDNAGTTEELLRKTEHCLNAGPNVRGLMIGRSVMYPKNGEDPSEVALRLAQCVHGTN